MIKKTMYLLMMVLCCACSSQSEKEKHQGSRDERMSVKDKIHEIDTGDVLIGRYSATYTSKKYLFIVDYHAYDEVVHIFDNTDYHHLASTGYRGQGPNELSYVGHLGVDEEKGKFYLTDTGKLKTFSYDIDSVLTLKGAYRHQPKLNTNPGQQPSSFIFINDTLSYCRIIQPTSTSTFDQMIGKWNMQTNELKVIGEKHPDTHRKRSNIDVDIEKGIIVEAYYNYDLMNISDLDGNIQCYIYGPQWETKGLKTFGSVQIVRNYILAEYSGKEWSLPDSHISSILHVFDLQGNYLKTLDIGYRMKSFVYDKTHHRLIFTFDDEIQFGYMDLEGIL